jgi:hypothetical protein
VLADFEFKTLAILIATTSALVALGCFLIARRLCSDAPSAP